MTIILYNERVRNNTSHERKKMEEDRFDACDESLFDCIDFDDDGQPSEYDEWQDFYGGDDSDHGQYDHYDEY